MTTGIAEMPGKKSVETGATTEVEDGHAGLDLG